MTNSTLLASATTSVLDGKSILITGGTGSFGKAFVDKALASRARKIIVFSRDEQKHYEMERRLSDRRMRFFVGDIRDRDRLQTALRDVDIVVHAAAMKHVPICEYNPIEAVQTNVNGARNLIEAAVKGGVKHFIFSSTAAVYGIPATGLAAEDSPLAPINPYGTSKLMSEWMLRDVGAASSMRHVVLRYFNVAGADRDDLACRHADIVRHLRFGAGERAPRPHGTGIDALSP